MNTAETTVDDGAALPAASVQPENKKRSTVFGSQYDNSTTHARTHSGMLTGQAKDR
jgi:hypothetical protein